MSSNELNSSRLFSRALRIAPGGVHSPVRAFKGVGGEPIFFKSANGAYLRSVEGIEYIDFCQSFGPNILGHCDPDVKARVHEQIDIAWSFGASEPYSVELGQWVKARVHCVERLRFVSSGTEAVMSAMRVARAATGRSLILKFDGCYHGHADSLLVKSGSGLAGEASSDSAGVTTEVAGQTLVANLDDEESVNRAFAKHGAQIAAVIVEPLPANFGLLPQRREFLVHLMNQARLSGSLMIFDEVISGFRVGRGGMAERLCLVPDLVTYGKILGGGFPVGCYGGRKELMELVAPLGPVYQAGTLSANPVGMVAGLETLKKAETENAWWVLEERTKEFCRQINQTLQKLKAPLYMDHFASLFWLRSGAGEPIRQPQRIPAGQKKEFAAVFHAALKHKVYLPPSGYEVGFLSLAHTPEILMSAVDRLSAALEEVYGPS